MVYNIPHSLLLSFNQKDLFCFKSLIKAKKTVSNRNAHTKKSTNKIASSLVSILLFSPLCFVVVFPLPPVLSE
jgi:hypothetical protein